MIVASAEALAETIPEDDYQKRSIYPCLSNIKEISAHVAARVMEQAQREGNLNNEEAKRFLESSFDDLKDFVRRNQWKAEYKPQVFVL